jgi:glycosyltransferase involved in cell wall biosynthesis
MKVAIDCTHFIKGSVGGFESYLLNLLDGLLEINQLKITLYILSNQKESFIKYTHHGAVLITVPINNPYLRIAWQNIVLPLYSIRHSVILFPANFRPLFLLSKSITVIHDLQYISYPQYWTFAKRLFRTLFIPYSILRSDKIIVTSNTVKNEIKSAFSREDIDVIYIPIVVRQPLAEYDRSKASLLEGHFFLIPSAIHPHKNIQNLLLAIEQLSIQFNHIRFVFVGPYNALDFNLEYKSGQIDVLGYVDIDLLSHLYAKCIAVILPSIYEGFGMPYVEATYAHKTVIASDIPIARELLGDDAVYIDLPFEKMQILAALEFFIQGHPSPKGEGNCKFLIENTTPRVVARKYISLLNEVL